MRRPRFCWSPDCGPTQVIYMVREAAERTQLLEAIAQEGRRTSTRSVLMHAVIAEKLGLNESDHK